MVYLYCVYDMWIIKKTYTLKKLLYMWYKKNKLKTHII